MSKITFIFLVSIILLWSDNQAHQLNSNEFFHPSTTSKPIKDYAETKLETIHDPRIKGLIFSYVFGINSKISKTDRQIHQTLNLKHLFSPSGLHISSILFLFLWLKRKKVNRAHDLWNTLIIVFFTLSFYLPGYYPLKRTLGFHILAIVNDKFLKKKKIGLSFFQLFLILMVCDFAFGSFKESPLSFTYSFLFWGIILSVQKFSHRLFYLGLGQLLVSYFSEIPMNPLSIITNVFLSPIFSFLFPLIFFHLILGFPLLANKLTAFYLFILEFVAKKISFFPFIYVDSFFLFFLVCLFSFQNLKLPKKIFFFLILVATPLNPEKISDFKQFKKSYVTKIKKPPEGGL